MCVIATVANGASSLPPEEGLASVYSTKFNGKITASGERYDGNVHTAAHRTLPFGTVVKVTNLDNGKSVRIAVTGIAKPDRSAAEDLEQLRRENAKLKMEIEILEKAAIYFAREAK